VAPNPLSPANGASVQTPFTISWSAVSDPSGILGYNWQISSSSSFSPLVKQDSVNDPTTQSTVSGLAVGTYFWRVQAVSGAFEQGPWSQPRSFTVTGAGAGTPGTPSLNPTFGYSTLHPWEYVKFTWSAVPNATTYFLMYSNDPGFPVGTTPPGVTTGWVDNIPTNTTGFVHALDEGTWYARVYAVSAAGIFGSPSNVISYTVFYTNPVPPAPVLIAPVNNPTLILPFALQWKHVINPQPMGYDVQISSSSSFTNNEAPLGTQLTNPEFKILSLTAGQKFWRVRSNQGLASRNADGTTTNAVTAWSATGTFTVSTAPSTPVSITPVRAPLFSGDDTWVEVQLTAGVPAGGATINLASSNQALAPVPATLAMQGTAAWTQFQMTVGQVTTPTTVTLTATLNGVSASRQVTVNPPSLKSLTISGSPVSGGATAGAILSLNGQAPASGAVVNLESTSPAVSPSPTVTIPPGVCCVSIGIPTNEVTQSTAATLTATWNGATVQSLVNVVPAPAPTSLTLSPATTVGGQGSVSGTVTIATTAGFDQVLNVTSNNAAVLPTLSTGVVVPAGSTRGFIMILPAAVSATTVVRISVTGGGVTQFADLTVTPSATAPPPATLSSFTVSPTSVTGGTPATGTVRLSSAAPSGGTLVTLGSNQPGAASVPSSVTVAAGATSATFTVTTFASAGTTVQLSATLGNSVLFAALGVNPPSPTAALSAITVNPTTVVGGTSATGTVTLSAAAPSGGATVSLSDNSSAATTPASITVPAGATSASFTVTTTAVTASATATISAVFGGVTRTVGLTINPQSTPAPPGPAVTVTVTATGRSGEGITSSPAGINVAVGSTGSGSFTSGTAITLSVSNGRDAIWSGACSSGGNKAKTCRFTPTANASVTANVQ
jgi:hypothetical protein